MKETVQVTPQERELIDGIAWTADRANGRSGMTLESDEVETLSRLLARLSATSAPAGVEGWKLVPVEPTVAMLDAINEAEHPNNHAAWAHNVWNAALAAAPTPSELGAVAPCLDPRGILCAACQDWAETTSAGYCFPCIKGFKVPDNAAPAPSGQEVAGEVPAAHAVNDYNEIQQLLVDTHRATIHDLALRFERLRDQSAKILANKPNAAKTIDAIFDGIVLVVLESFVPARFMEIAGGEDRANIPGGVERWQTGRDLPKVEQRHKDAAAWAMDRSPDGLTWDNATAAHVTPDRLWQMNRVAEAMARMERAALAAPAPSCAPGLDAATVERCALVAETQTERTNRDDDSDEGVQYGAGYENACADVAVAIRTLATDPHQHGAGNGEKHGG